MVVVRNIACQTTNVTPASIAATTEVDARTVAAELMKGNLSVMRTAIQKRLYDHMSAMTAKRSESEIGSLQGAWKAYSFML